ncbi:MAG TPA: Crp/Fnr family transcriptional regulator [Arachidicoccus soli]|nr:Crp/Fnr family transcriptional regulator [Arachidicoccus soli]
MTDFIKYCNKISPIDDKAKDELLQCVKFQKFKKGDRVLRPGQVCKHFYFTHGGLLKLFFYNEDKEFIMHFFSEEMFFTELSSYVTGNASKYILEALETTEIYSIHKNDIQALCKTHHCMEALFSKLFSFASIGMMKRISEMLEENGASRYNNFIKEKDSLIQRISLGDLACYLGITQVSLSRIRAKK